MAYLRRIRFAHSSWGRYWKTKAFKVKFDPGPPVKKAVYEGNRLICKWDCDFKQGKMNCGKGHWTTDWWRGYKPKIISMKGSICVPHSCIAEGGLRIREV